MPTLNSSLLFSPLILSFFISYCIKYKWKRTNTPSSPALPFSPSSICINIFLFDETNKTLSFFVFEKAKFLGVFFLEKKQGNESKQPNELKLMTQENDVIQLEIAQPRQKKKKTTNSILFFRSLSFCFPSRLLLVLFEAGARTNWEAPP